MFAEDREVLERIEGHLSDISVGLREVRFALAALAAIQRFRVEAATGLDPLAGTVYSELGFEDHGDEGEGCGKDRLSRRLDEYQRAKIFGPEREEERRCRSRGLAN